MTTTTAKDPGDEGEPVPVSDCIDAQLEAFQARFVVLQEEAYSLGIASVVLMASYDHMEKQTSQVISRRGNWFTIVGMIAEMYHKLLHSD